MNENGKRLVQSVLDSKHFAEFKQIKAHHAITGNADMIRFLIRQEARRVQGQDRLDNVIAGWLGDKITADEAMQAIVLQPK